MKMKLRIRGTGSVVGVALAIGISIGLSMSACGKKKDDVEPTEAKPLTTSGMVVDAPKSWTVKSEMDGFWDVERPGGHMGVQIMKGFGMPASLDEMVKSQCEGQTDVVKETLKSGGFYVQCKGPSQGIQIKGTTIITTKLVSEVPTPDGKSMSCHLETDRDITEVAAICRSLRKQ